MSIDTGAALTIRVTDSGGNRASGRRGSTSEGGGFGLAGLRERVELYGGTLIAGKQGQGFEVTAVIPWEEST